MDFTGIGIWSGELRRSGDAAEVADAAAELEQLGYTILWVPGGEPSTAFNFVSGLLEATTTAAVATGPLFERGEP